MRTKLWYFFHQICNPNLRKAAFLICILISENQGLEKSMSISNPGKISGSAKLDLFFQVSTIKKSWVYSLYYKPEKNPGAKPEKKKSRFAEPEIFLGFEIDLDFQ